MQFYWTALLLQLPVNARSDSTRCMETALVNAFWAVCSVVSWRALTVTVLTLRAEELLYRSAAEREQVTEIWMVCLQKINYFLIITPRIDHDGCGVLLNDVAVILNSCDLFCTLSFLTLLISFVFWLLIIRLVFESLTSTLPRNTLVIKNYSQRRNLFISGGEVDMTLDDNSMANFLHFLVASLENNCRFSNVASCTTCCDTVLCSDSHCAGTTYDANLFLFSRRIFYQFLSKSYFTFLLPFCIIEMSARKTW